MTMYCSMSTVYVILRTFVVKVSLSALYKGGFYKYPKNVNSGKKLDESATNFVFSMYSINIHKLGKGYHNCCVKFTNLLLVALKFLSSKNSLWKLNILYY